MLTAVPQSWFSWNFDVMDDNRLPVAEIKMSFWGNTGTIAAGGSQYTVSRQGILGPFVLEKEGAIVAQAVKRDVLTRTIAIEHNGKHYTLKARSSWLRQLVLCEGDSEIGAVTPENCFTHRARVQLPDSLPLIMRLFVLWITIMLWRRDSDTTPAGGGAE